MDTAGASKRTLSRLFHTELGMSFHRWRTILRILVHDAGDATHAGEFRKQIARAELERQFTSATANRLFGEFTAGVA